MKIEECEFPDDLLYDPDGLIWVRLDNGAEVVVGITSILAALGGKLTKVKAKALGAEYARGTVIGTLESEKYFGPIRAPVAGVLTSVNAAILERPKVLSESPYAEGWFARLRPTHWGDDRTVVRPMPDAAPLLQSRIADLRVHCFAAFPDYEMFEIGTECAGVLTKLNELLGQIRVGEVVHVVSDDSTAPIEMARWSEQTNQPIVESRQGGNLFHFLVRKVS